MLEVNRIWKTVESEVLEVNGMLELKEIREAQ
jgi:hypothetical protein